jgi:RimJ/RimL family protein N-acetyltransferase
MRNLSQNSKQVSPLFPTPEVQLLTESVNWEISFFQGQLHLIWQGGLITQYSQRTLLTILEKCFASNPDQKHIVLEAPQAIAIPLLQQGIATDESKYNVKIYSQDFFQNPLLWLTEEPITYPLRYQTNSNQQHPIRPPAPTGTVYQRYIPWLTKTLSFRAINITTDLQLFSQWMNDPIVDEFWQEKGTIEHHKVYLESLAEDKHSFAVLACFDDQPFGYFEIYWAKEDNLATYYQANDYDRGWHVLIGDPKFRGKPFASAWYPSIAHYLFLADARTQQLVIEPRSDNKKMLRNLALNGYAHNKMVEFPHKQAVLCSTSREQFFSRHISVPISVDVPTNFTNRTKD